MQRRHLRGCFEPLRCAGDALFVQLVIRYIQLPELRIASILDESQQEHVALRLDSIASDIKLLQHVLAFVGFDTAALPGLERLQLASALRDRLEENRASTQRDIVVYR